MLLNEEQISAIQAMIISNGFDEKTLHKHIAENIYALFYHLNQNYRFEIRNTIQSAQFADVYCEPYSYMPHIYKSCDSFEECLDLFKEWVTVLSYRIIGRAYYNKIFISHSSKDSEYIDSFVNNILCLGCGYPPDDIIYTSRQSTGVRPGENIPNYIKKNLGEVSLVLFMISENYKKSEVCLNEMGAAWALERKTVPLLIPGNDFKSIGWLASMDKALRLDDSEGLDKLYEMIVRGDKNVTLWNVQKNKFIKDGELYKEHKKLDEIDLNSKKEKTKQDESKLIAFDDLFLVRDVAAGEFQFQINVRLRALENVSLRSISLVNKSDVFGWVGNERKDLLLKYFVKRGSADINAIKSDKLKEICNSLSMCNVEDMFIEKEHQISLSFIGGFVTIRESDGYVDVPRTGWRLRVEYNEKDEIEEPLTLQIANGAKNCYFCG